jgi:AcrR family transcriptional regulator
MISRHSPLCLPTGPNRPPLPRTMKTTRPTGLKKRLRDPIRTKAKLLAAGVKLFARQGFHGVSVDEIVAAAACNTRMLYHYFGDKESLYVAVLHTVYQRLEQVEMKPVPDDAKTADKIRAMMARYFDFLADNPDFVNLLLWENLNEGRLLRKHPHLLSKAPVIEWLRDILEEAKRQGEIETVADVRHLLIQMIGLCLIYFSNRHTLKQGIGLDIMQPSVRREGLRIAQEMYLGGLGIRSEKPGRDKARR